MEKTEPSKPNPYITAIFFKMIILTKIYNVFTIYHSITTDNWFERDLVSSFFYLSHES